ncbi:MAG: family transposase, partial [Sphingomonas bacterium]|nr:family transposase [Sphingomonas bacterium]
ETVLAYLSRYSHRVATSNSRLIRFDETGVTFRYKDYRRSGADRQRVMTLTADELIRRFLPHVLPNGASTASATMASSPVLPARPGSTTSAICSGLRRPPRPMHRPNRTTPAAVPLPRRTHGRCLDLRAAAPTPRATRSCATIRDAGGVTRHGLAATDPAAPMLAEPMSPAPIAFREAASLSKAGLPALANTSPPPEFVQSASRLALASAVPPAIGAGPNRESP